MLSLETIPRTISSSERKLRPSVASRVASSSGGHQSKVNGPEPENASGFGVEQRRPHSRGRGYYTFKIPIRFISSVDLASNADLPVGDATLQRDLHPARLLALSDVIPDARRTSRNLLVQKASPS